MPSLRAAVAVVVSMSLVGCGEGRRPPVTTPTPADAPDGGGGGGAVDAGVAIAPDPAAAPPRVAPHSSFVTAVVLDRSGQLAASVDGIGGVRLWRALDGSLPPVALPLRGARALDVVRDGSGYAVGAVDASGAAHLFRLDAAGGVISGVDVPAMPQAIGIVAERADAWLVVRADQSIALVDSHGAIVDDLSRDGTRLEAVRPVGTAGAMVMISRSDGAERVFAVVPLTVRGAELVWGTERVLAVPPVTPVELAVAPDGKHLAYFADPAAVKAAKERAALAPSSPGAGAPAGPRRPLRPGEARADLAAPARLQQVTTAVAVVIDTATGANVTPTALAAQAVVQPQRLGFPTDDAIAVYGASGDLSSGLAADADLVAGTLGRNAPPAVGPGHTVAGLAQHLVVADAVGTRILGYQHTMAMAAALSPDGRVAAWGVTTGGVVIESLDTGATVVAAGDTTYTLVEFVDAATIVAVNVRGELQLIAAADGRIVARGTAPGSPHGATFAPAGGWLIGLRDGGGVWVVRVTGGAAPAFASAKVIADGSFTFWPRAGGDADAPALTTFDSSRNLRTYTGAQLATGVAVNKVSAIPKTQLAVSPTYVDERGRIYSFDGRALVRLDAPNADALTPAELGRLDAVHLVRAVPGSELTIVADARGTITALSAGGQVAWSVAGAQSLQRLTVSADGRRVLAVSSAGGQLIEVATGEVFATRCGWLFGAWPTSPQAANLGAASVCE